MMTISKYRHEFNYASVGAGAPAGSRGRLRRGRSRRLHGSALVSRGCFSSHHIFSPFPIESLKAVCVFQLFHYDYQTLVFFEHVFQHVTKDHQFFQKGDDFGAHTILDPWLPNE